MVERTLNEELAAQGTPAPDVDQAIAETLKLLRSKLEPTAVDYAVGDNTYLMSMAISMRRMAEVAALNSAVSYELSKISTGLNSLCTIMHEIKGAITNNVSALHMVEDTLRHNDGRELRITIAKE